MQAHSNYEVLGKIATGGMAELFLARASSSSGVQRHVVLKRILGELAKDSNFVDMFLDEARIAARLQHPNIAQVHDSGCLGDSPFFTMEYVHGETVRALLLSEDKRRRPLPLSAVLTIAAGAAAGLHHAHSRVGDDGKSLGIVHRDISPSNLMISFEGAVKVVDFGIAKAKHRSHTSLHGTVKGKVRYMSPEQCLGDPVDRRSDLFSLGIVMWEMLALERLYRRDTEIASMTAIVSEHPPHLSKYRSDIPQGLDELVMRLLEKDPAKRYQTADQVHQAIDRVAVRAGLSLSTSGLARYMTNVFGKRPEPWIATKPAPVAAEPGYDDAATIVDAPPPEKPELARGSRPELSGKPAGGFPTLQLRVSRDSDGIMNDPLRIIAISMMDTPPAPKRAVSMPIITLPMGTPPDGVPIMRPRAHSETQLIRNRWGTRREWMWIIALALYSIAAVVLLIAKTST